MASGAASAVDTPLVHTHHFQQALQRVAPSVSKKDQKVYDALRWQLRSSRGNLNPQVHHYYHPDSPLGLLIPFLLNQVAGSPCRCRFCTILTLCSKVLKTENNNSTLVASAGLASCSRAKCHQTHYGLSNLGVA